MTKSSAAIIGESRLARELSDLCNENSVGVSPSLQPDELLPTTAVVIETSAGDEEKKKSVLQKLDNFLSPASVIVASCLGYSTTRMASWINKPERLVGFATFYPDRKSTRLNSSHRCISYAVFCLKKK